MSGDVLGLVGLLVLVGIGADWVRRMRAVRIPRSRLPHLAGMLAAAGLGIAAFAAGTGIPGGIAAGLAALGGIAFAVLRLLGGQDRREPAVRVGGEVLDFTALDEKGRSFDLSSLRGKPFLLKFFRGHW